MGSRRESGSPDSCRARARPVGREGRRPARIRSIAVAVRRPPRRAWRIMSMVDRQCLVFRNDSRLGNPEYRMNVTFGLLTVARSRHDLMTRWSDPIACVVGDPGRSL